jgi:hypothetical protein
MFSKTRIALSLAIVLGAASAATAATKHPVHHYRVAVTRQVSGASAYGNSGGVTCPGGTCDPYNHQQVKCIGGACSPEWGIGSND